MSVQDAKAVLRVGWALALALFGCADAPPLDAPAANSRRGEQLFRQGLTDNAFTCATCHRTGSAPGDERVLPGAELGGVTERPSYWGGAEVDLLRALGYCQTSFMGVEQPLAASDAEASELYAFLESLVGDGSAVPFTVVRTVTDLPPGDAVHGAELYERTCAGCHGARETGEGALMATIPALPGDVLREHADELDALEQRLVFVEKVRHGVFLGYGGAMPPFSLEVLPDADLSDLLSALGLDIAAEAP